jgi:CPA1 family monovalent cation:H+ antiporter
VTLVLQGLTLPIFIRKSHIYDNLINEEIEKSTRQKMKHGLKQHVHQFLKDKYENELNGNAGVESLLKLWEERAKIAADSVLSEKKMVIFLELLESQRRYLNELNKDPDIDEEIIREQLYQIDLEEERMKII